MLDKTDLTDRQKIQLAAASVAFQEEFGAISELADQFGVSRNTVYDVQDKTKTILQNNVLSNDNTPLIWVPVDQNQLHRAIIALRCTAPNSLRNIEEMLPILYPGLKSSYGTIQAIVSEGEARAAMRNAEQDLCSIKAGALDEMFSQGDPIFGGVDLDTGFLFLLALREQRAAEDWADELERCQKQGLELEVVVKDAAKGIAAGVREVFKDAEQRDDCFHAQYEMGKLKRQLEQRAYGAINQVEELNKALNKPRGNGRSKSRQKLAQRLRWAQKRCDVAIALFDQFEKNQLRIIEAMELVDLEHGTLRNAQWMQSEIEAASSDMLAMNNDKCKKVGRYLKNRAPGLVLYAKQMKAQLDKVASRYGYPCVTLACIILRLLAELKGQRRKGCRRQDKKQLLGAYAILKQTAKHDLHTILSEVDEIFVHRYRASSAIEGFNASLRPYVYIHKRATQGFLELFRFYYNHRKRRWGRHKGTSAYQEMTGEVVEDWLTTLGYPPSSQMLN